MSIICHFAAVFNRQRQFEAVRVQSESRHFHRSAQTVKGSAAVYVALSQNRLQIISGGCDGRNVIMFRQGLQHIGGQKRRQCRPRADIPDSQVQKRQQDAHGLLFVPEENP